MKKVISFGFLFFSLICLLEVSAQQNTAHAGSKVRDTLNWDGIYIGVLPCADCQGVHITVTLNKNLTYMVRTQYVGKSDSLHQYSGNFTWNKAGNTIQMINKDGKGWTGNYLVGENILTQLDGNGRKITGALADHFILSKSAYAILGKYWKLIELYGKPIASDSGFAKEPFIQLNRKDHRLTGSGGCNSISGIFMISVGDKIKISKIISTRMACPSLEIESQFLKMLEEADSFSISADMLVLNRARMAPLARFTLASPNSKSH